MATDLTGLEAEVPKYIFDGLTTIGYTFGEELGRGGFGAVFVCHWNNLNNESERLAVKHIDFTKIAKYSPEFRWQTHEEREEYKQQVMQKENSFWKRLVLRMRINDSMVEKTPSPQEINKSKQLRAEIQAMNRVNHPNVIKLKNILQYYDQNKNPNPTHVFIFMEIADTDMRIKQGIIEYSESEAQNYSSQIIRGLAHLHSKGVAHLDIKPSNILVFNVPTFPGGVLLKITDFDISIMFPMGESSISTESTGATPRYCDPIIEQIASNKMNRRPPYAKKLSYDAFKADIWSYAIVVIQFIIGVNKSQLIYNNFRNNLTNGYLSALIPKLRSGSISHHFVDLMRKILIEDQSQRLSTLEVCGHHWIKDVLQQQREGIQSFTENA